MTVISHINLLYIIWTWTILGQFLHVSHLHGSISKDLGIQKSLIPTKCPVAYPIRVGGQFYCFTRELHAKVIYKFYYQSLFKYTHFATYKS